MSSGFFTAAFARSRTTRLPFFGRPSGTSTCASSGENPAALNRLRIASAAAVVLPEESVVLISINCRKTSRASTRVPSSSCAAAQNAATARAPAKILITMGIIFAQPRMAANGDPARNVEFDSILD